MICATQTQLPNNAFLGNVIIDCPAHQIVISSKIVPNEDEVVKWLHRETGKQMLEVIRHYVNQRERAIAMSRGLTASDSEAVIRLNMMLGGSQVMVDVAKRIAFHERDLWMLAPSAQSKFSNWRLTINELVDYSKHIISGRLK